MTRKEAIEELERLLSHWDDLEKGKRRFRWYSKAALDVALSALRHQIWEDQLWHDAKTDPPKTPGLYYGKKDDTNSMYPCQYRDGIWKLDMYPNCKIDIVQWADYTAFVDRDEESALRPVTREQVEKVWKGEWGRIIDPYGKTEGFLCKCGRQSNSADDFCPSCGKAMSKKAIDIVMERMKELGSNDD